MKSTRTGSFSVHRSEKTPKFQIQLEKRPLSTGTSREASGVPSYAQGKTRPPHRRQPRRDQPPFPTIGWSTPERHSAHGSLWGPWPAFPTVPWPPRHSRRIRPRHRDGTVVGLIATG